MLLDWACGSFVWVLVRALWIYLDLAVMLYFLRMDTACQCECIVSYLLLCNFQFMFTMISNSPMRAECEKVASYYDNHSMDHEGDGTS